jgi:hypothetical protein
MGRMPDKALYINYMKFEGSMDGTSYNELFVIGKNIHEGWNYHSWQEPADYPKYRYYRFSNSNANGCYAIHEIKF